MFFMRRTYQDFNRNREAQGHAVGLFNRYWKWLEMALLAGVRRATAQFPASGLTVDRNCEGSTDLTHAGVGEPAEAPHEHCDRDAFNRVQVDGRAPGDRIIARFQDNLAGERSYRRRARCHEYSSKPRDRRVTGQDDHGAPADLGQLTPPQLPPSRQRAHDTAAARRNDARSPHSSGSSSGCLS
jgi:hypothetical protein